MNQLAPHPVFPVMTHDHTIWKFEDPIGSVFPSVTVIPFEIA
jgi:hypothetical protein